MHESDAIEFIEPVLLGFLGRTFGFGEGEEPSLFEPHLKKIRTFISDESPYWVREKSLHLVCEIEGVENHIKIGIYNPTSPNACVKYILLNVKKRLMGIVEHYRLKPPNDVRMHTFAPLPMFPK
jgi:hypothetical protein